MLATLPNQSLPGLMRELFQAEDTDFAPARLHLAWRLTRRHAEMAGLLAADESLAEATQNRAIGGDLSTFWCKPALITVPMRADMKDAAHRAAEKFGGFALTPPLDQEHLTLWCNFRQAMAQVMGLDQPHPMHPRLYVYGSRGLFDPAKAIEVWPDHYELIAYEEVTVLQAQQTLIEHGVRQALFLYNSTFGLNFSEARNLLELARGTLYEQMYAGLEDERSLMKARLEDFITRAKASNDHRAEVNGYKLLSMVCGLTRGDTEDPLKEMGKIITKVADEHEQKLLEGEVAE